MTLKKKSSYLLNNMMNFNYTLGENVTNDNLKSIFTLPLENTFLKKNTGGSNFNFKVLAY